MEKELENICVEKCENDPWQTFNPDATKEKFSCNSGKSDEKCLKKKVMSWPEVCCITVKVDRKIFLLFLRRGMAMVDPVTYT